MLNFTTRRLRQFITYLFVVMFLLLTLSPPPLRSLETGSYQFDHIGKKDGLPDMTVFRIAQDHHGFIWFGTRNGVAKYDGIKINAFQHNPNDLKTLSHLVNKRTKELLEQKNKLEALSKTDPLTGALNRRGFSDRFKDEVSRNKRNQNPMTIVLSDIDDFKKINDTYGHDCGDLVLKEVVSLIRTLAREQDIIGRWGGEEFILLLPETPEEGALIFSERLRAAVANHQVEWNGENICISMTFGIDGCNNNSNMESIISNADKAL